MRMREKAERKENRRINRITNNINENIISTKEYKQEVASISLCDIDDFSLFSQRIHVTGGLFGLVTIILDELLKIYDLTENTAENVNFISLILDEFIFKCLKDNQSFEIKYLESERFNFGEISDERKPEFIDFIHDYRRFVNKSLKILVDKGQMSKNLLDLVLSALVALYFKNKNTIPEVEVNPENQDPEYIEKVKQEQEDYADAVARLEAVKNKIKFVMVKPAVLKKCRDNKAAFIEVNPSLSIKDTLIETDEIPASERPKITTAANLKSDTEKLNAVEAFENADAEENKAENDGAENNNENKNNEENNQESLNHEVASKEENENQAQKESERKDSEQQENSEEEKNPKENNSEKNNQANTQEGKVAESDAAPDKTQPKVFKIDYPNEAQVFKNAEMKYEPYVIHHKVHEYSLINIAKCLRRVLKKSMKIHADLNELVNLSNNAYSKYTQFVIDWIMNNEIYVKDKIVPIIAGPLETNSEEIAVPLVATNNAEPQEIPANVENPGGIEEQQAVQE